MGWPCSSHGEGNVAPTVDIIIPVTGVTPEAEEAWALLAERAAESAYAQEGVESGFRVIVSRERTLSAARNAPAFRSDATWLIFLDADDELDRHYVARTLSAGYGDILVPATLGVTPEGVEDAEPVQIHPKPHLLVGNHVVVGAPVRRDLFIQVGGFRELPILEDWDLWIRCWLEGGRFVLSPDLVYRVHVNRNGRNLNEAFQQRFYPLIRETYWQRAVERHLVP